MASVAAALDSEIRAWSVCDSHTLTRIFWVLSFPLYSSLRLHSFSFSIVFTSFFPSLHLSFVHSLPWSLFRPWCSHISYFFANPPTLFLPSLYFLFLSLFSLAHVGVIIKWLMPSLLAVSHRGAREKGKTLGGS